MKWLLFVLQLWFLLISYAVQAQAPESVVAFEYPPFVVENKTSGEQSGFAIDVYRALTAGTRLNGPIIIKPLARAKAELAKGIFLVGFGTRSHHMEAVAAGKLIPIQVGSLQFHFFHLVSNFSTPEYTSFEQYRKHTICGQNQSAATPVFTKLNIAYDIAKDLPTVFRKVGAGRCDFGFSSDLAFNKYVQTDPFGEQFLMDKFVILNVTADILINSSLPNAQKIVHDLRLELDRMRKDGSLQRMAEKNFGVGAVPEYFLKY